MNLKDKLKPFIGAEPSKWMQRAAERASLAGSQTRAQIIALNVLQILRDRQMTQVDLANRMKVSRQQVGKICKGLENLTLDTIDKLENALEVKLIGVELIIPEAENSITFHVVNEATSRKKLSIMRGHYLSGNGICYPGISDYTNTLITTFNGSLCSPPFRNPEGQFFSARDISLMTGIQFMTGIKDIHLYEGMKSFVIPKDEEEQGVLV